MASSRLVVESPKYQGEDESLAYTFDWSLNNAIVSGGTISAATATIKDNTFTDVSATCLSGSASVVGNTVVTPLVTALTAGVRYRLECSVTISGGVYEHYCEIIAEE